MHCENYIWSSEQIDEYCFPARPQPPSSSTVPLASADIILSPLFRKPLEALNTSVRVGRSCIVSPSVSFRAVKVLIY